MDKTEYKSMLIKSHFDDEEITKMLSLNTQIEE